jgi:sugar phosphate isomerase/epimerase
MPNSLAFSTLGCPAWNLDQILAGAALHGYDAIELRGYLSGIDLTVAAPFLPENRRTTKQRFSDANLSVCCVSSSGVIAENNLDHLSRHCELARDLDAPIVRIFSGKPESLAQAARNLRAFGDAAAEFGVDLVLETHDDFSTGASVAELLQEANHPNVFSLWDLHHPFRLGEAIQTTHTALRPTLRHVHIKDSISNRYTLLGDGDIPVFAMLDLILDAGYVGAVSLEWEKRWHPEIAEPEVAFAQYAKRLREYFKARAIGAGTIAAI